MRASKKLLIIKPLKLPEFDTTHASAMMRNIGAIIELDLLADSLGARQGRRYVSDARPTSLSLSHAKSGFLLPGI